MWEISREYWERKRFRNEPGIFMVCRKVFRALKSFKKAKKGPRELWKKID